MSFALDWLDLREPADHAARDPSLLAAAKAALAPDARIVDLGAGSGSTLRAFGGTGGFHWTFIDQDPALLAAARTRHAVEMVEANLVEVATLPLTGARLVTASALCDLVSRAWIETLADRLAAAGCGFYAALNYDGQLAWTPTHPLDAKVMAAFNAHQHTNKGFGPALGPASAGAVARAFRRRGYSVRLAPSPWQLGPAQAPLQAALNDGIARAASAAGLAVAADWAQARHMASGSAACTVGHCDVLALPA